MAASEQQRLGHMPPAPGAIPQCNSNANSIFPVTNIVFLDQQMFVAAAGARAAADLS
jgi:hypothetical protein